MFSFNLAGKEYLEARYLSPPGPKGGFPIIGSLLQIRKDSIGFFCKAAKEYGDVVRLFPEGRSYLFTHPEHVREILQLQHQNARQGRGHRVLKFFMGNGLLSSDGERHKEERRKIQPEFHRKRIAGYCALMSEKAREHVSQWRDGQEIEICQEMQLLTLSIVVQALFGTELKADIHKIRKAERITQEINIKRTINRVGNPLGALLPYLPLPDNFRFNRAVAVFDQIVYRLIEEKLKAKAQGDDLISMLLVLEDIERIEKIANQKKRKKILRKVRDQALTFFMAGHETTANALNWACYLLAKRPKVEAKMQSEIKEALQGRAPQFEDIPRLEYTAKVFKETLRLYPTAWATGRTVVSDFKIGSYLMRKGWDCYVSPYVTHRDSRWFPNPERFLPERWTESFEKGLPRYAYFPFGAGPRQCIGEPFAKMEAVVILASIFQKWKLHIDPEYISELNPEITLSPKKGIPLRLGKR